MEMVDRVLNHQYAATNDAVWESKQDRAMLPIASLGTQPCVP